MATRQYIGARYVPKFYVGSTGNQWDNGVGYEALTIVTYLNNSYTSKKDVPAGVGNPADNTEYWVCTGNYNAQMNELNNNVLMLGNNVNDLSNNIGDLSELETSDKSSVVNAINDIMSIIPEAPYVTPEDFGAIGNGINDDTIAIQTAVNTSNYVMFEQNKTYIISDEIILNNNQIINGNNSTIKIKDNTRINEIFTVDSKKNITLVNIKFDMNCQNMPTYNVTDYNNNEFLCKAIYFNNSYDLCVTNCEFVNLYTWAIFVYQSKGNVLITKNTFDSPAQNQGLINEFIRCNSMWDGLLTIINNIFNGDDTNNDYGTAGLSISNVHAKSIINGNTFINCGRNAEYGHRLACIDFYGDVYNSSITNNYIESVNMFIRLEDTKNILVDSNICKDVSTDGGPLSDGYIWIFHSDRYPNEPTIENITIRNNIFNTKTGVFQGNTIRIKEFSNNHNDIFIKNIIIENNKFYRGNNKGFSAIETDGRVDGLYIRGNVFDEGGDITYIIKFVNNENYNTVNVKCEITDNTFNGYIGISEESTITFNMTPLIVARNIFICTSTEAVDVHKGIFLDNYFSFGGIKTSGDATNNSFISGNVFDDSSTNPITQTNTKYNNNLKGTNILSNIS